MVEMIKQNFYDRFDRVFEKEEPKWSEVLGIFSWLEHEACCAREFQHLRVIDDLRRITETHFWHFKRFQKGIDKQSRKVNEAIKKRDEQLRTTASRRKGKAAIFGGETEQQRVPPSE